MGITLHNLGYVYERTRDAELLAALRRCLDLFNHTVAPEPDGAWMGATNFCPRTPDDWSKPQFGAGIAMLVGRAWMSPRPAGSAVELRAAEQATAELLRPLARSAFDNPGEQVLLDAADIAFLVWRQYASTPLRASLPALSTEPFTRTFGEEFMCVRRASYYAFLSCGGPMEDWQKPQRPEDARKQFPRNGGGLSMFWTPAFGTSILAKNWSAYAANTILALGSTGGADWEDYWSVAAEFNAGSAEARVRSALLHTAVKIDRRVRFLDDAVRCDVLLDVAADARADVLRECFPFPSDKPRALQVSLLDESGRPVANRAAAAVQFSNGSDEVHLLVFDQPRRCEVGIEETTDNYGKARRHGRILAEFAPPVSGRITARWLLHSAPAAQVALTIAAANKRLQAE
jgi:hypothetical protein